VRAINERGAVSFAATSVGSQPTGDRRWRVGGFETVLLAAILDGVKTGRRRAAAQRRVS
jgi:hypothetical protein